MHILNKLDFYFFVASFILTLTFIFILFPVGFKLGLVDMPGGRKRHGQIVPLIGGIAIFLSVSLLLSCTQVDMPILAYWLASFLLICVCIIDDKINLSPKMRFIAQSMAILIIIFFGDGVIVSLGNMLSIKPLYLGVFSIPFTLFAIIGVINAVNMTDGLDGLTGSVSIVESLMLLVLAIEVRAQQEIYILLSLIGGLLAFLFFNFPNGFLKKYRVFLGDSGSMFIGLTLAWACVRLTQNSSGYPAVLMLWVMALPIMDTIYLIINRKARGVSPFKSDTRHMHHILQRYFSKTQTVIIMSFSSFFVGITGLIFYWNGVSEQLMFYMYIVIFVLYCVLSTYLRNRLFIRKNKVKNLSIVG